MNIFTSIIGWIVIAALTVALAAGALCLLMEGISKAVDRIYWSMDAEIRNDIGSRINDAAYWFSESKDTSLVIRLIAESIIKGRIIDPSNIREEWRKERAKP